MINILLEYILIRLGRPLNLIFFVLALLTACRDEHTNITVVWTKNQATSIIIPKSLLRNLAADSVEEQLQVRLNNNPVAMLGEYQQQANHILFTPLIPLSRGSHYEVFLRNALVGGTYVPIDSAAITPRLVAVYPTSDTIPENLLKLYVEFSAPMRDGEALQHIVLLNSDLDTLPGIFLDLQPELWNKERTVLTLWLDPGRIKRDLIPNLKMGKPLQSGQRYTLSVSGLWKNAQGISLQHSYKRNFVAGSRDSISPQLQSWTMKLPDAGTLQPLKVFFQEPLDYFLLQETIGFLNEDSKTVRGTINVSDNETGFSFIPIQPWLPGHYKLQVGSQLEDLAGNNLERLFDRDMLAPQVNADKSLKEREFVIQGK